LLAVSKSVADEYPEPAPKDSAADALQWMQERASRPGQALFRGQIKVYPTIFPSLLRDTVSEELRNAWWSVTRRFISARDGLTGYQIRSPHDALAVIQHYLIKSSVIDVTGTPEIALYFALLDPASTETRVVYAADEAVLKGAGWVVTDHAFLALPLSQGGFKHRWLRQDGFTIGAANWGDLHAARTLDFLQLPSVASFTFRRRPGDEALVSSLGDLETVEDDPLASAVRAVFESIADATGCLAAVRQLIPEASTLDAQAQLVAEIEDLIARARALGRSAEDLAQLNRLLSAAKSRYWDTSWSAALDLWSKNLKA
jgi:hypothetical protein